MKKRNLLKAAITAVAGGYVLQTAYRMVLSLYIFRNVSLKVLVPDWQAIVLVLFVFYSCLPIFNVIDRKRWKKLTILAGLWIVALIWGFVIGLMLTI